VDEVHDVSDLLNLFMESDLFATAFEDWKEFNNWHWCDKHIGYYQGSSCPLCREEGGEVSGLQQHSG